MKKFTKLMTVLLALAVTLCAISIFALASDSQAESLSPAKAHKPAEKEGYFLYYDASADTFTEVANSSFSSKFAAMDHGDTIKLLSDIAHKGGNIAPTTNESGDTVIGAEGLYIDLNGYQLSLHYYGASSAYLIQPAKNTRLHLYSSDTSYKGSICCHGTLSTTGADKNSSIFNMRNDNSQVYLGDVAAAQVITGTTGNYGITTAACDGDNLETYSNELFTSYIGASAANPQGSSFNVGGGKHYKVTGSTTAMITVYCGVDVNLSGADFISTVGNSIISFQRNGSVYKEPTFDEEGNLTATGIIKQPADANVTVVDCLLYSGGALVSKAYESPAAQPSYKVKVSNISFTDCYLSGSAIMTVSSAIPTFENCEMPSEATYFDDGVHTKIKSNHEKTVEIYAASKQMTTDTESGEETWTGLWDITKASEETIVCTVASASSDRIVNISWSTPEKTVSESWFKGNGVIPSPIAPNKSSEVYFYDYSPDITSTEISGDKTYTLTPRISFIIRSNLALYSDFVYNLYIPKSAADSELFNSVRIDRIEYDGTVTEGTALSLSGAQTVLIPITSDYSEECYVISKEIMATEGDARYRLVISLDGCYGEEITHVREFSIPDYATRVNAGSYSAEAKAMVNATMTYIKAARNYFAGVDGAEALPYPTETNTDITATVGSAEKTAKPTASDAVNDVFYAMNLSLEDRIKFVFYIYPDVTDTIKFTYPVNTVNQSVYVTSEDLTPCQIYDEDTQTNINLLCYEISLSAVDLRSNIEIDLLSTSDVSTDYTYCLANYAYSMYTDGTSSLDMLLDALWNYSEAAYDYVTSANADSPTVQISIGGKRITAASYVIVAGEAEAEAAEELQRAIYSKTGELLTISEDSVDGKSSIFITVTSPSFFYDFDVRVSGENMIFRCGFKSYVTEAVSSFAAEHIYPLEAAMNFTADFKENYYTDKIYYSDFGAYGIDMDALTEQFGEKYRNLNNWQREDLAVIKSSLTNDFFNIRAAHEFANSAVYFDRYTVCADDNAVYYISDTLEDGVAAQIIIETPVNWGNANFVIDDSDLPSYVYDGYDQNKYKQKGKHLMLVQPKEKSYTITDAAALAGVIENGLNPGTTSINLELGYSAMIIPESTAHKVYRRRGYTGWAGSAMTEVILIDGNGNIDPSTPVIFDYSALDKITVYRVDIPELTVKGGTFTTIESSINCAQVGSDGSVTNVGGSVYRGIDVQRSNTRIENVAHVVIGEYTLAEEHPTSSEYNGTGDINDTKYGANYSGFFSASNANAVTFYGCTLEGRRNYNHSSYELNVTNSNNVTFESCIQSNFWIDGDTGLSITEDTTNVILSMSSGACWGCGGTNNSKNLTYLNSTLSRFDAHRGVYNGNIINSNIIGFEIIGYGQMLIENSSIYKYSAKGAGNAMVYLRDDYGSTWDGDIIFKDVKVYHYETEAYNFANGLALTKYTPTIVSHTYSNWYFGYDCYFPNIVLDNVTYHSQLDGRQLTAAERGAVKLVVDRTSFLAEPNMHLDTAASVHPVYTVVDEDGDGYIDGSASFDADGDHTVGGYSLVDEDGDGVYEGIPIANFNGDITRGITAESYANLNKTIPPESIVILNERVGYDYSTYFRSYLETTSFFDSTEIYVERTDENGNLICKIIINDPENTYADRNDSPIVNYE